MNKKYFLDPENQILATYRSASEAASAARERQGFQHEDSLRGQANAYDAYNKASKRQQASYARQIWGDSYQKQVDLQKYNDLVSKLMRGSPLTPEEVFFMKKYVSDNNIQGAPTLNYRPIGYQMDIGV